MKKPIMIHGFMGYRCKDCGKTWKMYLETGVEDHGKNGRPHQPCPFGMVCIKCGGFYAYDVTGYIPLPVLRPLDSFESGTRFFAYDNSGDEMACGRPRMLM